MSISITVPKEYGYVLLTVAGTFVLSTWHGMRVGPFRRAAKIPYPTQYASDTQIAAADSEQAKTAMYLFNCAQRAHYNFLENYITFVPALLIAGLKFPVVAAALGAAWSVFRTMYATGYTRADKTNGKGRMAGAGFWLAQFALYGIVGKQAFDMIL